MRPMPDAEYAVTTWLRGHADVAAFGGRIDIRYPGAAPAVVVERIGGTADYLAAVDHPRLDITVWHTSKVAAHDYAATVRQALHQINGQVVGDAACGGVTEVMGLRFVPDEMTEGTPRYMFTAEITMRAVVPQ